MRFLLYPAKVHILRQYHKGTEHQIIPCTWGKRALSNFRRFISVQGWNDEAPLHGVLHVAGFFGLISDSLEATPIIIATKET